MAASIINLLRNHNLVINLLKTNLRIPTLHSYRNLSLSTPRQLVKVTERNEGDNIIIEGEKVELERKQHLLNPGRTGKACPLCALQLNLEHTDVLILKQFLRGDGTLLHRQVTGLCVKQQMRVKKLVSQAQRAGLLPYTRAFWEHDEDHRPYVGRKLNRYFKNTTLQTEHFFKYRNAEKAYFKLDR